MNMYLLSITTAIYFYVGIEGMVLGSTGMGICYFAYGIANIGLMMSMRSVS